MEEIMTKLRPHCPKGSYDLIASVKDHNPCNLSLSLSIHTFDPTFTWFRTKLCIRFLTCQGTKKQRLRFRWLMSIVLFSEMGSHYVTESGFYITSFAATIFVAALLTVVVLLITLLTVLAVMLQSCESRSSGIVEISKSNDNYDYCKVFFLHAELNKLDVSDFPEICKITAFRYIKEGQYAQDLNITVWMAENYFNSVKPQKDGLDLVLMDIDDFFPSSSHYTDPLQSRCRFGQFGCNDCDKEAKNLKHVFLLGLYTKLQAAGWPLILFSRKPEKQQTVIVEHLISAGYVGWSSLVMRLDDEMEMDSHEHFFRLRNKLQKQGFRITAVISSRMDALTGPSSGKRVFKLPNPIFHNVDHYFVNLPQ